MEVPEGAGTTITSGSLAAWVRDTVEKVVVVRTELAVQVMPAQLELHTFAKFIQKRVLRFGEVRQTRGCPSDANLRQTCSKARGLKVVNAMKSSGSSDFSE